VTVSGGRNGKTELRVEDTLLRYVNNEKKPELVRPSEFPLCKGAILSVLAEQ
jgi:hypothetical protein